MAVTAEFNTSRAAPKRLPLYAPRYPEEPKHSGDIPAHLLSKMARDLGITRKQLLELAECTLSQEEYEKHLRSLPRRPPSN